MSLIGKRQVQEISSTLIKKIESASIYIVGHADSEPFLINPRNSNGKLSLERARSVAKELEKGTNIKNIQIFGFSDGLSAVDGVTVNATSIRRVDIFIVTENQILDWYRM